jgi:ribonuclease HI
MDPKHAIIYTDGACEPNPGPGGYGVVLLVDGNRKELSGGYRLTTNNRMEIMAAIVGLQALKKPCKVFLHCDSRYLTDAMTKGWATRWKAESWHRKKGERVPNADLWQILLRLCDRHEVDFIWVRGHSGDPGNERADFLSYRALEQEDLPEDEGFQLSVMAGSKGTVKITREGQPCRKCSTQVVKMIPKRGRKGGQQYYYEYYLHCPGCKTNYMVEEAKRHLG